jgi:hypothetical protein
MGSIKSENLRIKRNRPPQGEPFIWLTRELLESDAWRTAPLQTRRFLERVMLEHMAHAGTENGRLVVTVDQCKAWGIPRNAVTEAQRDARRRGLVYLGEQGCWAPRRGRRPNRFGLGWLPGHDGSAAPNNWKAWGCCALNIDSIPDAGSKMNGRKRPNRLHTLGIKSPTRGPVLVPTQGPEKINSRANLPEGWRIEKGRITTHEGTVVPLVQDIGTTQEQKAKLAYDRWRLDQLSKRLENFAPVGRVGREFERCSTPPRQCSLPTVPKVDHEPPLSS